MSPSRLFSELRACRNRSARTAGDFDRLTITDQGAFRTMSDDPMFGVVGSGARTMVLPDGTFPTARA